MYMYHIVEFADGEQHPVEIIAKSLDDALQIYIDHSTTDACESVTREGNVTTFTFLHDKLEVTQVDEFWMTSKWTHLGVLR